MTALFTKSYDELREAFVRARFDEEQEFQNENIEAWLTVQRESDKPEGDAHESPWNYYLTLMLFAAAGKEATTLCRYALPLPSIPRGEYTFEDDAEYLQAISPLLERLHMTGSKIYYGHVWGPIAVFDDHAHWHALVFEKCTDSGRCIAKLQDVHSMHVMDAIFATWMRGGSKSKPARRFLCQTLAAVVAKSRKSAEEDFDRAVAVSADGRKIVHADEVVVFDKDGTRHRFASGAFSKNKILRIDHIEHLRRIIHDDEGPLFQLRPKWFWLPERLNREWEQELLCRLHKDERALFTKRHLCPDPLPDGEIK